MTASEKTSPPAWARKLLRWYCKPSLLEDLEGDLEEYFDRNVKRGNVLRAKSIYVIDVIKFFRPYTVRQPEFLNILIQWIMLGSYMKTSARSIVRNKLFSAINIFGLAISMSVGLLTISILSDLYSYDDYNVKKNRIYRVNTHVEAIGDPGVDLASTSMKAGKKIQESIAGIESITILKNDFGGDALVDGNVLPLHGFWANQSFFNVFTFPLLQGNPATALKDPYSVVLTEQSAVKLFGTTNVLGKSLKVDTLNYVVTGVMHDVPALSHIRFDALGSFETLAIHQKKEATWENIYSHYVYLVLPENGNTEAIQTNLDRLSKNENAAIQNKHVTLSLQPLANIPVGKHYRNQIGPGLSDVILWILGGLAFIVMLSACFNYTNLSIARSLRRSREVGIRKVIGALRSHVMAQFIAESTIISVLSLVFALGIFIFLRAQFLGLDPYLSSLLTLELSPKLILYFFALAIGVGLSAGFLPAIFFSRINAIAVLKNVQTIKIFQRLSLRKALIVVQYTFSLIFITTTVIGYFQYKSFLSFDLGFSTGNIVNISLQGNKGDLLAKELAEIPEVEEISKSLMVMSLGSLYGSNMKYTNPQDSERVYLNFIDQHYLPLHHHKFLAGKNFTPHGEKIEESEAIVNEALLKRFNIGNKDPQKAIGETVKIEGKDLTIIAVLKDFHYGTADNEIEPMMFRYSYEPGRYLNVKVSSADLPGAMAAIGQVWKKLDRVHPIEASFYDDQIQQAYGQFMVMIRCIGFLAFLAVCISSLGLFGMVVFTTETRLKEISIRKVLGASEGKLIYLLGKGFLILLLISAFIALPATFLLFDKVILSQFAYHQPIGWFPLFSGVILVMIIALIMIGSQTIKVARSNPSEVLKNE